jgi:FGGY-family pentulose kinase
VSYFIGVDVGTGSARAGIFHQTGKMLAMAKRDIRMWTPRKDYYEQSSDDIWNGVCEAVRQCVEDSGVDAREVKGIGFDAACSLVVLDGDGSPVSISLDGGDEQNVVVWMDHRAIEQTERINSAGEFPVFDFVGGKISPEMQIPKLLWLKEQLPDTWRRAGHFFDLPDFLTHKATGGVSRSLCSLVCKWTYLGHEEAQGKPGWQADFLQAAGLEDLVAEQYSRMGAEVLPMGQAIRAGLSADAARAFGLPHGIAVGASLIDAHAGGIGMLGLSIEGQTLNFDKRLALIGGTSSCHMAVSEEMRKISGVWGPYYSAMVPGMWLNEGGQSATGSLVDHIVFDHGAYPEAKERAIAKGQDIYQFLNDRLHELAGEGSVAELTRNLHVCPYFHGNRSPRANPHLRGMITGLSLSCTIDDLALLYLATIQAIAYGTRHIIEAMNESGYSIDTIIACGGGTKNPVFLQQHANATGCRVVLPEEREAVLLGASMLGACASGQFPDLRTAMQSMSRQGEVMPPEAGEERSYHDGKYKVFHELYADQVKHAAMMGTQL